MKVRFGDCELDLESRELFRADRPVRLLPKAFELLKILLASRPRAISKAELQERLWPATFVSESNLTSLIAHLRKAVRDSARTPRLIRTVHRFGYAFSGEAIELPVPARPRTPQVEHWLIWGTQRIPLAEGENILGRDEEATAHFDSPTVSRRHARIQISGREAILVDLGSKNGTFLRGERVMAPTPLSSGDQVRIGSIMLTFRAGHAGGSTLTHTD